ncbi:MAG TPA: hypothetical protein DCS24_09020 [Erythrobacter sp.]|nr:hypothetical protein [Erythrobacter sp.]
MTLSNTHSGRFGVLALALVYTGLTFGAAITPAPALAKASGPYYTAELASPASDNRVVASGVAWSCEGTNCRAGKGTSRPLRICRGLHREFGEVVSFKANGKELDEANLARCNGD